MPNETMSFPFGKNWQDFIEHSLTPEKIATAKQHLLDFLEMPNLRGKYFLDIGCGSGLSSLAAYESGADNIVSFDRDSDSVSATNALKKRVGSPTHWIVLQGSILDTEFIRHFAPADIVYSWGVLHHTGKMWEAFENASTVLAEAGLLYISLYTTTPKSQYWSRVKKAYNTASSFRKRLLEIHYMLRYTCTSQLLRGKNPIRHILNHQRERGMSYFTDLRDWLGGYPYEDAKIEEVLRFARKRLRLELINIATGHATTEYVFARKRT